MLREHRPVPQRPDDAVRLHDLAVSRQAEGRLQEAVPLCGQGLALVEHAVGPHHPDVANILNTLAGVYENLGDYAEAERLSRRSVAMMKEVTGNIEMEVIRVQSLCTWRIQNLGQETPQPLSPVIAWTCSSHPSACSGDLFGYAVPSL